MPGIVLSVDLHHLIESAPYLLFTEQETEALCNIY